MNPRIEELKQMYPAGTRVKLIFMDDHHAPPEGALGTVRFVDDLGSIHVNWDCGKSLALIDNVDKWIICNEYDIYVDGAYHGKKIGWGCVIYKNGELLDTKNGTVPHKKAGGIRQLAGELQSILEAIESVENKESSSVNIYTDSLPAIRLLNDQPNHENKFIKHALIKFKDLTKTMDLKLKKVKAHSNNWGNDFADVIARKAIGRAFI